MPKIYKRGFYGGKFLPFHTGHRYCIQVAAEECEELYVLFFANSEEEAELRGSRNRLSAEYLDPASRIRAMEEECGRYGNVVFTVLDCAVMHRQALADGTSTWDAETVYVLQAVGDFQAVYSSEPGYDAYFRRAYPFAQHRLIDPPRIHVPISGTKIRGMNDTEANHWIIQAKEDQHEQERIYRFSAGTAYDDKP